MDPLDEQSVSQDGSKGPLVLVERTDAPCRDLELFTPPRSYELRLVPWSVGVRSRWGMTGRLRSSAHVLRGASRERRFARHVPATSLITASWPFARPLGRGPTTQPPIELHTWRTREPPKPEDGARRTRSPLRAHALRKLATEPRRREGALGGFFSFLRAWIEDVAGR